MTLGTALAAEFDRRRRHNPRYSLRAFARSLGASHSAVSRLRRQECRPSDRTLAVLGGRLGWSAPEVVAAQRRERVDRLRALAAAPGFAADARWIAQRTAMSLDEVQVALQEALRLGTLAMPAADRWRVEE
ncbi:MAG: hypothetical protein AB7O28_09210 [Vicinamibacterales bacterium]